MSFWDYITPHRLLLNSVLRRDSQILRDEVNSYQIEYDNKLRSIESELKESEDRINKDLESVRTSLNERLKKEETDLVSFRDNILRYIDKYQHYLCIDRTIDICMKKKDILQEDMSFLSEQMDLIKEEVSLIDKRIQELSKSADVTDILKLAEVNGYYICDETDPRLVLEAVNNRISRLNEDDKYERIALQRLRGVVQERTEYSYVVDYLSWVIQSKKKYRKQLNRLYKEKKSDYFANKDVLSDLYNNKKTFNNDVSKLAEQVRLYWASPIAFMNADIRYLISENDELKAEKERLISKHKEIKAQIMEHDEMHLDYEYYRESLKQEKKKLSCSIDQIKDEIKSNNSRIKEIKEERSYWLDLRTYVKKLCWEYNSPLKSDRNNNRSDEELVIIRRLEEIEAIRIKGIRDANEECERRKMKINYDYGKEFKSIDDELLVLNTRYTSARADLNRAIEKAESSKRDLEYQKKSDNRGFFAKLLSDAPNVARAKYVYEIAKAEIIPVQNKVNEITNSINSLQSVRINKETAYNQMISQCKPVYLRPTDEEELEERKLKLSLAEIENKKARENDDEN